MTQLCWVAASGMSKQLPLFFRCRLGLPQCFIYPLTSSVNTLLSGSQQNVFNVNKFRNLAKDFVLEPFIKFILLYLRRVIDHAVDALVHKIDNLLIQGVCLMDVKH